MDTILAIDTDLKVHEQQTAEWNKCGVSTIRVSNMGEAITTMSQRNNYLFIAINENTNPDFYLELPVLRASTSSPIFVVTSSYSTTKRLRALESGADAYDSFEESINEDVQTAIWILKAQQRWTERASITLPVLFYNGILISKSYRRVFVKGIEINLTNTEYRMLCFFIECHGCVLSYEDIFKRIWKANCDNSAYDVIWAHVKRLRKKLTDASPSYESSIINRHGIGYMFL